MKKLFIFSFVIFSIFKISAQSASGQTIFQSNVCCFNGFTWTINYEFIYNDNNARGIDLEISRRLISVKNNKYQYEGKQYSPSDLGMSEWPVQTEEASLSGTVTIYYKGSAIKTYNEAVIISKNLGRFDQYKDGGKDGPYAGIGSLKIKLDDFNLNDFSVRFTNVSSGGVNPNGSDKIYKAVKAKLQGNTNSSSGSSNSLVINSSSSGSSSQNSTPSNTSTTTQPIDNYDPKTGLYSNPMTLNNSTSNSDFQKNYETGQQIATIATGIVDLFSPSQEELQRRQREENLRIEREEKAAAVREEKARIILSRKELLKKYPDGKTPLSFEAKNVEEVYFFVYSYNKLTLENDSSPITISNVFTVPKYNDGTWPFKVSLMQKIIKENQGLDLILSGYYESKDEADQKQKYFVSNAKNAAFNIKMISFSFNKNSETSVSSKDFWNDKEEKEDSKTTGDDKKSITDYWGNPVKQSNTPQPNPVENKSETKKPKPKVDFWGNPIKE